MITNNFRNLMASLLSSRGSSDGYMECKDVNGNTRYICDQSGTFPYYTTTSFTLYATSAGVSVGSGTTAAAQTDYQLESPITSGVSGSQTAINGLDEFGNKYIQIDLIITNTGSSSVTIGEIAYKQTFHVTTAQGASTGATNAVCLVDRTVLATPVTIAAGDYAVIRYTLKTVLYTE